MEQGIHNSQLEWSQGVNNLPGVVYLPTTTDETVPKTCYGGDKSVYEQYTSNLQNGYTNNTYTTLGDPLAGYL